VSGFQRFVAWPSSSEGRLRGSAFCRYRV